MNEYLCLAEELSIKRFLIRDPDFDPGIGSNDSSGYISGTN